jgi:hypothetical protein
MSFLMGNGSMLPASSLAFPFVRKVIWTHVIIAVGLLACPAFNLCAGVAPGSLAKDPPATVGGSPGPFPESAAQLKKLQDKMIEIGGRMLGQPGGAGLTPKSDAIVTQKIAASSANADYENAKLTREIAEIAILEFEHGIFKQDQATLKGELVLAQSDVDRAEGLVAVGRARLERVKKLSKSSLPELSYEATVEARLAEALLRVPRSRAEMEKAKSKLEILEKFFKPRRIIDLKAEVERARSKELAKQAAWERVKSNVEKLEQTVNADGPHVHEQTARTLLKQAVPIAEELRKKLSESEKAHESDELVAKEIAERVVQLRSLVDLAEQQSAAAEWSNMKPKIRAAATRFLGAASR